MKVTPELRKAVSRRKDRRMATLGILVAVAYMFLIIPVLGESLKQILSGNGLIVMGAWLCLFMFWK